MVPQELPIEVEGVQDWRGASLDLTEELHQVPHGRANDPVWQSEQRTGHRSLHHDLQRGAPFLDPATLTGCLTPVTPRVSFLHGQDVEFWVLAPALHGVAILVEGEEEPQDRPLGVQPRLASQSQWASLTELGRGDGVQHRR